MVQRWLYSTNAKDISILYFMLAIFSGIAGTAMSLIIRMELAAPGVQYLNGNNQLFNGAPYNAYYSLLSIKITVLLVILSVIKYVNHIANSIGANPMGTIACYKKGVISTFWGKCYMIRLTNFLQISIRIAISSYHLDKVNYAEIFYIEVFQLWLDSLDSTSSVKEMKDLNNTNGYMKSKGLAERGNSGVNRGIVVSNIQQKLNYIQTRQISTSSILEKDTSTNNVKEINTSDLKELTKLQEDNINKDHINKNLICLIKNKDILILAYDKIKSKPGNITMGTTKELLDGINHKYFDKLSNDLGSGRFKFQPVRRVEILKLKGGTRSLSVGNFREKIVQENMRIVLNTIFDNKISEHFHGFRSNHSCHTAVWEVRNIFSKVNWFVEVDLTKCFDTIPHNLIIQELNKYIEDKAFIDLVYKLLRTGYIDEKGIYHKTKVGVPQGSVVSPLLSNIVLNLVDTWIYNYIEEFTKGKTRKITKEYKRISRLLEKTQLFSERIKLQKIRRATTMPFLINDPSFKRIKYVRYADDILIGVIGSKQDCIIVKEELSKYLNSLGLTINQDKTLITCASKTPVRFLGYNISVTPYSKEPTVTKYIKNGNKIRSRHPTRIILNAPITDIVNKIIINGFSRNSKTGRVGFPTRVGRWVIEEPRLIINNFLTIGFGLLNYYKLATNYNTLKHRLWFILYYSCVLTLAGKYRTKTISKTIKKFGFGLKFKDDKGNIIAEFPRNVFDNIKNIKNHGDYLYSSNFSNKDPFEFIEIMKYRLPTAKAVLGRVCIVCNSTENIEIHHIKKLVRGKLILQDYMKGRIITINRKQVPVCKNCHIKHHINNKKYGPGI